jgi:hypothetical protein
MTRLYSRRDAPNVGLSQPFPRSLANQLEREYGQLNDIALALIKQELIPAIAANDDTAINIALDRIHDELAEQFTDDRVETDARAMATRVNNNHSKKFFAAVGVAVGVKILGSDSPKNSNGILGGGAGGGMPPTPGFPGFTPPKPGGSGVLGVKVSVGPDLFADDFVAENVRYIGELRASIREGLGDAIVRARQFGGNDPDETARRLLEIWEKNGVPAQLPTTRLKANGQPVMLSTQKHAKFVAHDQISKLNANLTETRQRAAGVTRFRWVTMGDSRVRASHTDAATRDVGFGPGIYEWQSPPSIGLPGQPYNCRCHAEAVIDKEQVLASGDFVEL